MSRKSKKETEEVSAMAEIRTNLSERLADGRKLARAGHLEKEVHKLGNLRAGNSGIMSENGDVAGACQRVAHLRQLGLEVDPPDDSTVIMFQMGTANEDVVYADLLHTSGDNEIVLREEEIPITWITSNGTKVTGRPDMVICKKAEPGSDPIPVFGVEIKSIASVWTSRDIIGEQQPKLPHLVQAGHYSWKLGVPFRLLYKQYVIQEVPSWAMKLFPKEGQLGSEHIDYAKGRIRPFEVCYELEWAKGFLRFRREGIEQGWTKTLISEKDIERFYEFTSRMAETEELGPRPITMNAVGKEKNYSNCSYCPLSATCDQYEEKGYKPWLRAVQKVLGDTNNGK